MKWNPSEEFKRWLVWAEAQDIVEEVYTKPKANWICGRCGWTTNEGDRATLHMWACGQFSLFRN